MGPEEPEALECCARLLPVLAQSGHKTRLDAPGLGQQWRAAAELVYASPPVSFPSLPPLAPLTGRFPFGSAAAAAACPLFWPAGRVGHVGRLVRLYSSVGKGGNQI